MYEVRVRPADRLRSVQVRALHSLWAMRRVETAVPVALCICVLSLIVAGVWLPLSGAWVEFLMPRVWE
jgi:hypothetical protein